ncbi:MAG TPA: cytochrome b/b6 domain-containing protein [Gammaproteobacteria bacterium]|nr:cytochrome b/b6 domain-containing protein [Gammaproteobacteria bacterium]
MNLAIVRVWDLPVRLFHWGIVALLGYSWWSGEEGGMTLEYHMWSGYAVLTLVLFRVLWGFAGSGTARFASFVRGPAAVLASLRELGSARPLHLAGHNPLGGWMVLALLLCLLVQTSSGLFANDDLFNEGPLYEHVSKALSDTLTTVHHLNFGLLLGLVALHVAAVAWHRLRKGERLVGAMIHGRKRLDGPAPALARARRALPWLALSAGVVAFVVNL